MCINVDIKSLNQNLFCNRTTNPNEALAVRETFEPLSTQYPGDLKLAVAAVHVWNILPAKFLQHCLPVYPEELTVFFKIITTDKFNPEFC